MAETYFNAQNCYPITAVAIYFQVLNVACPSKHCLKERAKNKILPPYYDVFDVKILITL